MPRRRRPRRSPSPSSGGRQDLTAEAIRLTRLLRGLIPTDGEATGLLALMLLIEARRAARVSTGGELINLADQDRGAWDATLIAEGHRLVRDRLAAGVAPGRYQLLAAINAVHTSARDARDTDWSQIVALYNQLACLDASPIVALNRAVAIAELDGPEVALAIVDRLQDRLAGYHAHHATRADLLCRLGRPEESHHRTDQLRRRVVERCVPEPCPAQRNRVRGRCGDPHSWPAAAQARTNGSCGPK